MNGEATIPPKPSWLKTLVIGRNPKRTLIRVATVIVTSFVVFKFVLKPIRIEGISMAPSYRNGSWNLVNKLAYVWTEPRRGDVVAIRMAGEHVMLMKRIVGLPGEHVKMVAGRISINNEPLEESYVAGRPHYSWKYERTLGEDEYFFIGDNRTMRVEDHYKGFALRRRIAGKVLF
jgi:signal peptidase I